MQRSEARQKEREKALLNKIDQLENTIEKLTKTVDDLQAKQNPITEITGKAAQKIYGVSRTTLYRRAKENGVFRTSKGRFRTSDLEKMFIEGKETSQQLQPQQIVLKARKRNKK